MTLPSPCICLVTDRLALTPDARTIRDELANLERQLDAAIAAGVDMIQIRERDLDSATLRVLAARLVARAAAATRVIVNDRADVARAVGAAGVHLRASGPPAADVRTMGPAGWVVGRSVHAADEAPMAGADYLMFGTVFASRSKPPDAPVGGVDGLRAAAAASPAPVLAIGGVTPGRVAACREAGAAGVGAIGVFLPRGRTADSLGPAEAVAALRRAWIAASGQ